MRINEQSMLGCALCLCLIFMCVALNGWLNSAPYVEFNSHDMRFSLKDELDKCTYPTCVNSEVNIQRTATVFDCALLEM